MRSNTYCPVCGERNVLAPTGRPKKYCSSRCRVIAYRSRPHQLTVDQCIRLVEQDSGFQHN